MYTETKRSIQERKNIRIVMMNNMKRNSSNIADWIQYWDRFDRNLYIEYLIAKQKRDE